MLLLNESLLCSSHERPVNLSDDLLGQGIATLFGKPRLRIWWTSVSQGFPGGSEGKESACSVGDPGSIPGMGSSPGEGNGNPPQYSYLGNPVDTGGLQSKGSQRTGHN